MAHAECATRPRAGYASTVSFSTSSTKSARKSCIADSYAEILGVRAAVVVGHGDRMRPAIAFDDLRVLDGDERGAVIEVLDRIAADGA